MSSYISNICSIIVTIICKKLRGRELSDSKGTIFHATSSSSNLLPVTINLHNRALTSQLAAKQLESIKILKMRNGFFEPFLSAFMANSQRILGCVFQLLSISLITAESSSHLLVSRHLTTSITKLPLQYSNRIHGPVKILC